MAFVAAKCTNCGRELQLDDNIKTGYCMFCGSKIIVREAIDLKKVKTEGKVSVEGLATLETLLQNAQTFRMLGNRDKEKEILIQVTDNYPHDYRGWWGLAFLYIEEPFDESRFQDTDKYHFSPLYENIRKKISEADALIGNAFKLAPAEEKANMQAQVSAWHKSYAPFFESQYAKIKEQNRYEKVKKEIEDRASEADRVPRRIWIFVFWAIFIAGLVVIIATNRDIGMVILIILYIPIGGIISYFLYYGLSSLTEYKTKPDWERAGLSPDAYKEFWGAAEPVALNELDRIIKSLKAD